MSAAIIGRLAEAQSAALHVDQHRCAKVRNRNVECLRCAAACTSGCISVVDGELVVDGSKCVGCGTCATVCPTCALEARNPTDAELLSSCLAARRGDAVVIACSQAVRSLGALAAPGRVAEVVCAGRVDESCAVSLAAKGILRVEVLCGACDACAQRYGRKVADAVAQSANALLEAWGSDARMVVTSCAPRAALADGVTPDQAKRAIGEYFKVERACDLVAASKAGAACEAAASPEAPAACDPAAPVETGAHEAASAVCEAPCDNGASAQAGDSPTEAAGAVARSPEGDLPAFAFAKRKRADALNPALQRVMKDGTLPHFVPDRRDAILNALACIGDPVAATLTSRLWGCVVIDGTKCTSCRMCATFCPTGALAKFDDADGTFGVAHYPGDCVKCGSCRDVCPEGAIVIRDEVKPAYLLGGATHRYTMREREVPLGGAQQIVNTMRARMAGVNLFER